MNAESGRKLLGQDQWGRPWCGGGAVPRVAGAIREQTTHSVVFVGSGDTLGGISGSGLDGRVVVALDDTEGGPAGVAVQDEPSTLSLRESMVLDFRGGHEDDSGR